MAEVDGGGEKKGKRVWILGAGFSRPLGAPLLNDLFTMRGFRKLQRIFPNVMGNEGVGFSEDEAFIRAVYIMFHWGRGFPEGHIFGFDVSANGEGLYQDAEDFMVQLERFENQAMAYWMAASRGLTANGVSQTRNTLAHYVEAKSLEKAHEFFVKINQAAARLMALECAAFHEELIGQEARLKASGSTVFEPFIPYREWAQALGPNDTLICFNYDLVAEFFLPKNSGVRTLKLHGSVEEPERFPELRYSRLRKSDYFPNIGVPGSAKANKDFKSAWDEAGTALASADHVIFFGYGLPESDGKARADLLSGLRLNTKTKLKIEIVLGEPNFRTARLQETLAQGLAHRVLSDELSPEGEDDINEQRQLVHSLWVEYNGTKEWRASERWARKKEALEQERLLRKMQGSQLQLTVRRQYTQDYMQAFASARAKS